ncbi:MAG: factor activating pos9 [Cyphobasidiales sp. Tagirdzhanova-0007]|nr:MAG: factor activating pos9 [Cyphobasidiales sp. Tagirdzhanova-0007]
MPPSSPAPGPSSRKLPNIVVTGTPGTGKTSHAQAFLEACPWRYTHLNVGEIVKEKGCHEGWNEEWQSYDVDDDRLLDELESHVEQGGKLIDWHSCEIFPERWVDLVIVIRCDHSKLWERLEKRGYPLKKIQENNEAEIMQTVLEEARSAYTEEIVVELRGETPDEMESNVERMVLWVRNWRKERGLSEDSTEEELQAV